MTSILGFFSFLCYSALANGLLNNCWKGYISYPEFLITAKICINKPIASQFSYCYDQNSIHNYQFVILEKIRILSLEAPVIRFKAVGIYKLWDMIGKSSGFADMSVCLACLCSLLEIYSQLASILRTFEQRLDVLVTLVLVHTVYRRKGSSLKVDRSSVVHSLSSLLVNH